MPFQDTDQKAFDRSHLLRHLPFLFGRGLEFTFLKFLCDIVTKELLHVRHQKRAQQQDDRKWYGRVKDNPERAGVRHLERPAHGINDLRIDAWDLGEIAGCDSSKEGFHGRLREAGVCGSRHDVLEQVLVQLVREDGRVQGCRDGAAEAADGAQDAGCEADVLGFPDERHSWEGDVFDEADGWDVLVWASQEQRPE